VGWHDFAIATQFVNFILRTHSAADELAGLVPLFGTAKAFNDHIPNLVWTEYGTKATGVAPSATAVDAQPRPDNEERSTP